MEPWLDRCLFCYHFQCVQCTRNIGGQMTVAEAEPMCATAVECKLLIGTRTMSFNTLNLQHHLASGAEDRTHALQNAHSPHSREDAKKRMSPASIVAPPSSEYTAQSPRRNVTAPDRAAMQVITSFREQSRCCTNTCSIDADGG